MTLLGDNVFWQLCKHEQMLVELLLGLAVSEYPQRRISLMDAEVAVHFYLNRCYSNTVAFIRQQLCVIRNMKKIPDITHSYM